MYVWVFSVYIILIIGSVADSNSFNKNGKVRQVTEDTTSPSTCFHCSNNYEFDISQPYFAFILFEIPGLGCNAIPVRVMQPGFRSIQLLGKDFKPIDSVYILVRADIMDCETNTPARLY
jgi:hypothetical protein